MARTWVDTGSDKAKLWSAPLQGADCCKGECSVAHERMLRRQASTSSQSAEGQVIDAAHKYSDMAVSLLWL